MYQQLVAYLFPAYVIGCLLAVALAWNRKGFYLACAYSWLLIVFQFISWGNGAGWGYRMFLAVSIVQFFMGFIAHISSVRASRVIALCSIGAIMLNLLAMTAFLLHHPIRQIYFIGMNTVQTIQIGSLIAFAPAWPFLAELWRKLPLKRSKPWTHQMVDSGRLSGPIC